MTSFFGVSSTSPREYAHAHDEHAKALTQPLPIAQEGPTGTRSARRRPLATAGTLEHQQPSNTVTGREPYGVWGLPCAKRTDSPSTAQATAVGCTASALHLQRYVTALCPPAFASVPHCTKHKVFRSIGIARFELVGACARCYRQARSALSALRCTFARLCDTPTCGTEHGMSVNEHDRPDCLYQSRDCSYQKRVQCVLTVDSRRGQSRTPEPSLGAGWRVIRNPSQRGARTPAIDLLRYRGSKKIGILKSFALGKPSANLAFEL